MKIRVFTLVAVAIMMISLFTVSAMAADQTRDRFVDNDGDGVCDNFVDNDGDGICDNCQGDGDGVCDNFVDNDGDGICDNCDGDGDQKQERKRYRSSME